MSLEIGLVLTDRYRIDGLLGEGGMGAVYRAHDIRANRTVAVKEHFEDPTGRLHKSTDPAAQVQIEKTRERFQTEAQVLGRLKHPGLPAVHGHFAVEGQGQYLVMDLIEGQDLQVLLQQVKRLPPDRVIEIGIEVCEILEYLHAQHPPVIHRDVKPANLRMTPTGQVVLVDFGICKENIGGLTKTAARAVSEGFSPPEMYTSKGQTDPRSDVYSLGATLYALVTGEIPATATDRLVGEPIGQFISDLSDLHPQLGGLLSTALSLKPEDRYQSAAEMKLALTGKATAGTVISGGELTRLAAGTAIGEATRVVDQATLSDEKQTTQHLASVERRHRWVWTTALGVWLICLAMMENTLMGQLSSGYILSGLAVCTIVLGGFAAGGNLIFRIVSFVWVALITVFLGYSAILLFTYNAYGSSTRVALWILTALSSMIVLIRLSRDAANRIRKSRT